MASPYIVSYSILGKIFNKSRSARIGGIINSSCSEQGKKYIREWCKHKWNAAATKIVYLYNIQINDNQHTHTHTPKSVKPPTPTL